ncbi:MAG: DEAD/DEAH box helicase [Thermoplasmatota archaeon]
MIRFHNDRFHLPRLPDPWSRQLELRGLPQPLYDRGEKAWVYDEGDAEARAVRFLHDAYHVPFDEEAAERMEALQDIYHLRSPAERLSELMEKLRPYQREGVEFALAQRRVLIADAMGLGKTLQALAALEESGHFPALVVCPASVKLGWQNEILKWLPWRSCQVVQSGRSKLDNVDILIVNPELLEPHLEDLRWNQFRAAVFDEAHYFKNPRAKRTQHATDLARNIPLRIALTGTPIQNKREDLVQQLVLLGQLETTLAPYKGVLPHWWTPSQGPLRWDHAMRAVQQLPRDVLHARLKDVCMIRRTKWDVAQDLPSFDRARREVPLGNRRAYAAIEKEFVSWVDKLRERDEATWSGTEKLQGRQHLSRLRKEAALGKIGAVVEWAEEMREGRERVVFFAYHKAVVKALAAALPGRVAEITGDTNPHNRRVIIDSFKHYDFIVATMDSTGQGVDGFQHHCSHVAFVELDWTPTKHEQCEGRLHRIGQKAPVTAWYFTAEDTIEGAMIRIIDRKWEDVTGIVDGHRPDAFMADVVDKLVALADGRSEAESSKY